MRKYITSSVFFLLFSLFSGALFAGDKGVCDENEYGGKKALQKAGVYGLCVAYQNADDADKPAIAEKFKTRFGFDVPGLEQALDFNCPCFERVTFADVCSFGTPVANFITVDGIIQSGLVFFSSANDDSVFFDTFEMNCSFAHYDVGFNVIDQEYRSVEQDNPLVGDEPFACLSELEAIGTITAVDCELMGY